MARVRSTRARGSRTPTVDDHRSEPGAVQVRPAPSDPMADEPALVVGPGSGSLRLMDLEHGVVDRPSADGAAHDPPRRVLLLPPAADPTTGLRRREVVVDGWRFELELEPAGRAALRARARRARGETSDGGPVEVRAIIPGVVVGVSVASGDVVEAGQQLLAVEAMKMQNELRAPRGGRVERVAVAVGRTIEVGELLVVIQ